MNGDRAEGVGVEVGVLTATVRGEEVGCMGEEPQVTGVPDSVEGPKLPEFKGVLGSEGLAIVPLDWTVKF